MFCSRSALDAEAVLGPPPPQAAFSPPLASFKVPGGVIGPWAGRPSGAATVLVLGRRPPPGITTGAPSTPRAVDPPVAFARPAAAISRPVTM